MRGRSHSNRTKPAFEAPDETAAVSGIPCAFSEGGARLQEIFHCIGARIVSSDRFRVFPLLPVQHSLLARDLLLRSVADLGGRTPSHIVCFFTIYN